MSESPISAANPRRRWLRFSLRTLLVVTALLCIWLAVVSTRARKQARAIARMEQFRWGVGYDFQLGESGNWTGKTEPSAPAWLRKGVGEEYFRRVAIVNVDQPSDPSNDDLAVLADLRGVKQITLYDRKRITDAGLAHLSGMTDLRKLALNGTSVTGPGLRHIAQLRKLELLSLDNTPVTDEGLAHLRDLRSLKMLFMSDTKISDEGLRQLTHLSHLDSLEDLQFSNTNVTDEGLKHLYTLTGLKRVLLGGTNTTPAGVSALREALPNCKIPY